MKGVQERYRECYSRTIPLGVIRFWLPSSDRNLASTGTSSETVALEIVGSTLHVDTVKGESRTSFTSVFATWTIGSVFETNTR